MQQTQTKIIFFSRILVTLCQSVHTNSLLCNDTTQHFVLLIFWLVANHSFLLSTKTVNFTKKIHCNQSLQFQQHITQESNYIPHTLHSRSPYKLIEKTWQPTIFIFVTSPKIQIKRNNIQIQASKNQSMNWI